MILGIYGVMRGRNSLNIVNIAEDKEEDSEEVVGEVVFEELVTCENRGLFESDPLFD